MEKEVEVKVEGSNFSTATYFITYHIRDVAAAGTTFAPKLTPEIDVGLTYMDFQTEVCAEEAYIKYITRTQTQIVCLRYPLCIE